ncbi:hypothetical protein [Methylomicrobium lacus]|uniref:hypothetical protein n=1 Tax=Methylomicrobium lacus TaxID=136992 RepID=UPI0035A87A98
MKLGRYTTAGVLLLLAACSIDALAHGGVYWGWGHPGFSFYFGVPFLYPPYYYRPYPYQPYYYPPAYQLPVPPAYIEPRRNPAYGAQNWSYCPSADGYYPNVTDCPEGWQSVRPYPDGQAPGYWYYCDEPAGYYPYVGQCARPWRQINP